MTVDITKGFDPLFLYISEGARLARIFLEIAESNGAFHDSWNRQEMYRNADCLEPPADERC